MASRYELPFATTYVPDWTYVQAFRELFQNALDNETENPENEMLFEYDKENQTLSVCNKTSALEMNSLLLGSTTKANNEDTIGQHGEGYKIAFLVLLREHKTITVLNYGKRETWEVKLVKSRRYSGNLVPVIKVNRDAIWKKAPSHDLTITVGNISEEEYENVVKHNLNIQDSVQALEIQGGNRVLTCESERGNIYVKGLFVCHKTDLRYGYDFAPKLLKLDRDRRMVESFDLVWSTSGFWKLLFSQKIMQSEVMEMIEENALDVRYIENNSSSLYGAPANANQDISESLAIRFRSTKGSNAIPVTCDEELETVNESGKKPVIVNSVMASYLKKAQETEIEQPGEKVSVAEELENFMSDIEHKLTESEIDRFMELIDSVRKLE